MVFLDTCVWIELLAVKTPVEEHEKRQASIASGLLSSLLQDNVKIITTNNQLLEILFSVYKGKIKEYNRSVEKHSRIGNVKAFRKIEGFEEISKMIKLIMSDMKTLAENVGYINFEILDITGKAEFLDINDVLYYDYCNVNSIKLYTFDKELSEYDNLQGTDVVVLL